jgi:hypothetical protein
LFLKNEATGNLQLMKFKYFNYCWLSYRFRIDAMRLNVFLHIAAVGEEFVAHLTHELRVRYLKRRKQHRMRDNIIVPCFFLHKKTFTTGTH